MNLLKTILKSFLKKNGYKIIPFEKKSSLDTIYSKLLNQNEGEVKIFDVGSHRGESIERFKKIFSNPIIHAFEPENENFKVLEKIYKEDNNIILNNFGIGNINGNLTFHSFEKTDVGGFNPIDTNNPWTKIRSMQSGTKPSNFETSSYDVPVKKLDDYIKINGINRINLLKIDTQGFEDEVLQGCLVALKKNMIDFIELEIIIKGPYEKTLQFGDIESILCPLGYNLYGIKAGSDYFHSPILQFDVLFVRSDCYVEGNYLNKLQV